MPAAIGVALAHPDETIWAIVGDGGFQMTNQELATMVQEDIRNVKIAIINNGYLGMVRQWQELFEGKRYSGTPLSGPDFARLAEAYDVLRHHRRRASRMSTAAIDAALALTTARWSSTSASSARSTSSRSCRRTRASAR